MKYMAEIEVPDDANFVTEKVVEAEILSAFDTFYGIQVKVNVYVPRGELVVEGSVSGRMHHKDPNVWLG